MLPIEYLWCNYQAVNALQYPLFCVAKVPVLHGKRAYIATQNRLFWKTKAMLLFYVVIFTAVSTLEYELKFMFMLACYIGFFGRFAVRFEVVGVVYYV